MAASSDMQGALSGNEFRNGQLVAPVGKSAPSHMRDALREASVAAMVAAWRS